MTHVFCFDFDGVVCDSAPETALSAWNASRVFWPELPEPLDSDPLSNRAPKFMKQPVRKQPLRPEKLEVFPEICKPPLTIPAPADRSLGRAASCDTPRPNSTAQEVQRATPLRYNTSGTPARPAEGRAFCCSEPRRVAPPRERLRACPRLVWHRHLAGVFHGLEARATLVIGRASGGGL